jgi:hypothetical protein
VQLAERRLKSVLTLPVVEGAKRKRQDAKYEWSGIAGSCRVTPEGAHFLDCCFLQLIAGNNLQIATGRGTGGRMKALEKVELLTLSYRGDYEVCRLLCESVDRFVPADIEHRLAVPRADLDLFASLANSRRRLIAQEDLLPNWFVPVPRWLVRLVRLRRNLYLTPFSLPVRGWIAQQIMKISAAAESDADVLVHVDSDNAFVRPFSRDSLFKGGSVRLYRDPVPSGLASHQSWQRAAGRLLGLPDTGFHGGEYIDPLVTWRPDVARGLVRRIEEISGRNWVATLARTQHFAEYVLYGVYADKILGLDAAGHVPETQSLSHPMWSGSFENDDAIDAFVDALEPQHAACLIQSTLAESIERRREVFERVTGMAERQDRKRSDA